MFWLLVPLAGPVHGDMGVPILAAREGAFDVKVLVVPSPLRVGTSEWNVLVTDGASGGVVLDADVEIELEVPLDRPHMGDDSSQHEDPIVRKRFVPELSGNRLFYAAPIELTSGGIWNGWLRVSRGAASATIPFEVDVAPARSAWLLHWRAFAIAPVCLVAFGLHQWRVRQSPSRR